MTIRDALHDGAKRLTDSGITSARLDSEVLLSWLLKKPREYLLAHDELPLKSRQLEHFNLLISRRRRFEPIAYIIGAKEFFGNEFKTGPQALIPRPETEQLVSEIIAIAGPKGSKASILDIGTGTGAIAISLAKTLPKARILALDSSPDALKLAKINAKRLKAKIRLINSDLLLKIKDSDVSGSILAVNLPYLDRAEIKDFPLEIRRGLKFEPSSALYAGRRGTALYEKLFKQILRRDLSPAWIIAEIGSHNWRDFLNLARSCFPEATVSISKDLAKRPRILKIEFRIA